MPQAKRTSVTEALQEEPFTEGLPSVEALDEAIASAESVEEALEEVREVAQQEEDWSSHEETIDLEAMLVNSGVMAKIEARVEQRMAQAAQATADATAELRSLISSLNPSRPSMTMRANIHDNFLRSAKGSGPHKGHFRCERLKSVKIIEYDMACIKSYQEHPELLPLNEKNRRRLSAKSLCVTPQTFITVLDGNIYPISDNQVEQLLWMRDVLPQDQGGMPDMYEDAGGAVYRCKLCPQMEPFGNEVSFARHMYHVHGQVTGSMLEPQVTASSGVTAP